MCFFILEPSENYFQTLWTLAPKYFNIYLLPRAFSRIVLVRLPRAEMCRGYSSNTRSAAGLAAVSVSAGWSLVLGSRCFFFLVALVFLKTWDQSLCGMFRFFSSKLGSSDSFLIFWHRWAFSTSALHGRAVFCVSRQACDVHLPVGPLQSDPSAMTSSFSLLYSECICFPLCLISDVWAYMGSRVIYFLMVFRPVLLTAIDDSCLNQLLLRWL